MIHQGILNYKFPGQFKFEIPFFTVKFKHDSRRQIPGKSETDIILQTIRQREAAEAATQSAEATKTYYEELLKIKIETEEIKSLLMYKEGEIIREQKQTKVIRRLILFKNEYGQDSLDYHKAKEEYYHMYPMKGEAKKRGDDGED